MRVSEEECSVLSLQNQSGGDRVALGGIHAAFHLLGSLFPHVPLQRQYPLFNNRSNITPL